MSISILPKKAIEEFREIYQEKYHILLAFEETERKADNFLRLMALITNDKVKND